MSTVMDQKKFYTVYRGKQSRLRHLSYMRMAKVQAARWLLARNGIALSGIRILDYGFGAGTFFLYCDRDCALAGLELDPVNVGAVRKLLGKRGYGNVKLGVVNVEAWAKNRAFRSEYDLVVLSHVLEHLDDPVAVLRHIKKCLPEDGLMVGLLPLNEIAHDENHKWVCDQALVKSWARDAGMEIVDYAELDHQGYWAQPVVYLQGRLGRIAAQGLGLSLGMLSTCMSPQTWFRLGSWLGRLTGGKPSQAVFLFRKAD